ncbi:MAG: T9SS type A sorting domain-containing protein [Bacteroidales bacterium]
MSIKRAVKTFIFSFFFIVSMEGQIQLGGIPGSFSLKGIKDIPVYHTPGRKGLPGSEETSSCKSLVFAHDYPVNINPENHGTWENLPDGTSIWRILLVSTGAYSTGIILEEADFAENARLFLYTPDHEMVKGGYSASVSGLKGIVPLSPLKGDSIIVEYNVPDKIEYKGFFKIAQINHGFLDIFGFEDNTGTMKGRSGKCNVDINCPEGSAWQNEKRAVCKMIVNGKELCTGTLINNTANDGKPYILTANHCIDTENAAYRTIFYFNHEKAICNGKLILPEQSISASTLLSTTPELDYSLSELGVKPPFSFLPFLAGWNRDTSNITSTVTIHHPNGDVKKISIDLDPPGIGNFGEGYDYMSHWHVKRWETGTTEGGSSGGPLFDQNHRIIGDLTGGQATCINPVNDYFSMISRAWEDYPETSRQLKPWLDPLETGVKFMDGMNMYHFIMQYTDTLTNKFSEEESLLFGNPEWGYITGHNAENYTKYAENFLLPDSTEIIAIIMNVAKARKGAIGSYITLKVWEGDSLPGEEILSYKILISSLNALEKNFIPLPSFPRMKGNVFAGYEIYYNNPDTFALFHSPDRIEPNQNMAFVYTGNSWKSFPGIYEGISTSIDLELVTADTIPLSKPVYYKQQNIFAWPNPSSGTFSLSLPDDENPLIEIFDLSGKRMPYTRGKNGNQMQVKLNTAKPGIYLIRMMANKQVYTTKIIVK